jgi:Fe-S-cluster containining protein
MIEPSKILNEALHSEDTNLRFRSFLKAHANPDELDAHFAMLHDELFGSYDCRGCNNCCKEYTIFLNTEDIERIAVHLGLSHDEFVGQYLAVAVDACAIKKQPCGFLNPDGSCRIYACRPSDCAGYPFTDRPGRLASMLSVIEFAEICPVVFEILERLKIIYHFS